MPFFDIISLGGEAMKTICCVYKLTNTVTGKFYVGSTYNLKSRMKYHRYSHDRNPNKALGGDIAKYGWDAFTVEVLEECTRENVREREAHYIETLHAVEIGYNQTKATTYKDWMRGYNAEMWKDPEYRKRRSAQSSDVQKKRLEDPAYLKVKSDQLRRYTSTLKKPVGMFSKTGELLHTFAGVREAERWLLAQGVVKTPNASQSISDCARGGRHKTAYGYVWKFL
jgi:group I intron endonuclease